MWISNGGIIAPERHGDNPREVHDTDPWGIHRSSGGIDIYGLVTTHYNISGMSSGGVHMPESSLEKHKQTSRCDQATEVQLQCRGVELSQMSGEMYFGIYWI